MACFDTAANANRPRKLVMKPKYHFFKNSRYALQGLKILCLRERSFQIECGVFVLAAVFVGFADLAWWQALLLLGVIWQVLIAEAINSALEGVVDWLSPDFDPRAGVIKDVGSAVVFLTIVLAAVVWLFALAAWILHWF